MSRRSAEDQLNDDGNRTAIQAKRGGCRRAARVAIRILVAICALAVVAAIVLPLLERAYYRLEYVDIIQQAAEEYQVNPYWIIAIAKCESDFDPEATSSAGAIGIMQMMPETAEDIANLGLVDVEKYPPDELTDPEVSINYGTAYLRYLVERYHEMDPAITAYNAGLGNVDEWLEEGDDIRDNIEFEETSNYLRSVHRAKEAYERLYPDAFTWDSGD